MGWVKSCSLGVVAFFLLLSPPIAFAQQDLIKVELDHPDFRQAPAAMGPEAQALASGERSAASKLKVPLLVPNLQQFGEQMGVAPAASKASLLTDENNPVWYHYENELPGLTVSVEADLRIQNSFPATYQVYGDSAASAAVPATEPLAAEPMEEGMANGLAQYTITRYNVPYTVTIVCEKPGSDQCTRFLDLAKGPAILKLAAAPAK